MREGSERRVTGRIHPDRRVQAVVEQVREAEMVQAVDRLRLIHSPREKTVVILCNIPLDLPVDELVTWRELAGDDRLEEAPALCEENGWDALPLAPEKLSELTAQKGTIHDHGLVRRVVRQARLLNRIRHQASRWSTTPSNAPFGGPILSNTIVLRWRGSAQ